MASRNGKFGVGILIDAENRVTGPAERAARSMMVLGRDVAASGRVMQTAMQAAAGGIQILQVGVNALRGMFKVANEAGKFEQEMVAVKSIIGATGKEFEMLSNVALKAGLDTQFSPLQASNTMRALAQAGLTAVDAVAALRPALDLSAASLGKLAPEKAATTLNATLKTFQLSADQSGMAMNALINATNRYNISIEQLPVGIGNIARGARALNQDMDSTLAVLGLTKNILPNISSAATLTSSAMLRIADSTVQKKLGKLGVTFQDAQGKFLPLIEIFNNLNNVLKNKYSREVDRAATVTKLLGKRAIAPFAAVTAQLEKGVPVAKELTVGMKGVTIDPKSGQAILKGAQAIKFLQLQFKAARGEVSAIPKEFIGLRREALKVQKEAGKGRGTGDIFVKNLLNTFRGQVVLLKGAWESFLIVVGKPLIAAFKPWVSLVYYGLSAITTFILGLNQGFKETIGRFAVGFSVSTLLIGAWLALKAVFIFIKPHIWAIAIPLLKILAVAALLTLAAEGMRHVWNENLGGIKTAVTSVWMGIKQGFNEFIGPLMNELIPFLGAIFKEMVGSIVKMLQAFGLVSKDTTGKVSVGWMEIGRVLFSVFAFFLKVIVLAIAGVAQFISWIATLVSWVGIAARAVGGFFTSLFGGKKELPIATVTATAGGRSVKLSQVSPLPGTTAIPTPATVPIGTPGITPPTQVATPIQQPIQQPISLQSGVPMHGTVTLDRQQVGTILFDHQRENQARGLIRTTTKEQ